MGLVITADWHLSPRKEIEYNSKVQSLNKDIDIVCQQLRDHADKNMLIIAGDLFDNNRPNSTGVSFFRYLYNKYLKNFERVIIIDGNHDASDVSKGALDFIKAWEEDHIVIIDKIKLVKLQNFKIVFLPHLTRKILNIEMHQGYDDAISKYIRDKIGVFEKADIVIGHGMLEGATMGSEQFLLKKFMSLPVMKPICIFGHVHKPQCIDGNKYYCGSPVFTSFSEIGEEKRFLVVDRIENQNKIKSVKINGIQEYKEILINCIDSPKIDFSKLENGKYIYKIRIKSIKENSGGIDVESVFDYFNKNGFVKSLGIENVDKNKVANNDDSMEFKTFSPSLALGKWVNENIKEEIRKEVISKGEEIISFVDSKG